jgi:hypothetical protein
MKLVALLVALSALVGATTTGTPVHPVVASATVATQAAGVIAPAGSTPALTVPQALALAGAPAVSPPRESSTLPPECPSARLVAANPDLGATGYPRSPGAYQREAPPTKLSAGVPQSAVDQEVRAAFMANTSYNLTVWVPFCYGAQTGPINPGGTDEVSVRAPATAVYGLAIALTTGAYDPAITGISAAAATKTAIRLIVGLAMHQRAYGGASGWGHGWQSAYWTYYVGTAGWLLSGSMTPMQNDLVARMVADEADTQVNRPAGKKVLYYQNAAGTVLTPGDTKAEEDSWDSTVLSLAALMLPNDTRKAGWKALAAQQQIGSFSRHADLQNTTVVDGAQVNKTLGGSNLFDNGTLVNHNIVHPEYMGTAVTKTIDTVISSLGGKQGLESAFWNVGLVYRSFENTVFATPPYLAPGGTIYKPGQTALYFPQGDDWGTTRISIYLVFDSTMEDTGIANAISSAQQQASGLYLQLHLTQQLTLQARFTDGRTYGGTSLSPKSEYRYAGREQVTAGDLGQLWLTRYLSANGLILLPNNVT